MADAAASPGGPRVSESKKRRLAALEKSIGAQQKQQKQQQQQPRQQQLGRAQGGTAASTGSQAKRSKTTPGRPGQAPAVAGNSSAVASSGSRGPAASQQSAEQEPIYARLSVELSAGPLAQALQLPEPGDGFQAVGNLLEDLIRTNPRRGLDARAAVGLKVSDRALLLDNPAVAGRQRPGERRFSRRLAPKKQQRELGLYSMAATGVTYEQVLPLHQRWRQYISALLAGAGAAAAARPPSAQPQAAAQQGGGGGNGGRGGSAGAAGTPAEAAALAGAELHGCLLRVAESCDPRWRGVAGIVVRDTQHTFVVVTKESRVVALPKRPSVFEYSLGRGRVVRLLGANLVAAAAGGGGGGRARKK